MDQLLFTQWFNSYTVTRGKLLIGYIEQDVDGRWKFQADDDEMYIDLDTLKGIASFISDVKRSH